MSGTFSARELDRDKERPSSSLILTVHSATRRSSRLSFHGQHFEDEGKVWGKWRRWYKEGTTAAEALEIAVRKAILKILMSVVFAGLAYRTSAVVLISDAGLPLCQPLVSCGHCYSRP